MLVYADEAGTLVMLAFNLIDHAGGTAAVYFDPECGVGSVLRLGPNGFGGRWFLVCPE